MKLSLQIVTPERIVYEDEVDQVSVTTETGEITVLPGHIPLVSALRAGEIRTKDNGKETLLAVSTGFIEVRHGNKIVILADSAERAEELDIKAIEEARANAKRMLLEKRELDDVGFAAAAAAMERELARHRVAMKHAKAKGYTSS
ncbi:TPA: ATP synthase F1 subunit epsilon [Candidatus Uhrbacteria bacterium]|nr:ATP synthase F1 subunit epsilon [Candidatus Uhrbacteria bacterium]